ncbi:MAG TPA: hypothetical protein VGP90_12710 [Acidimicrobiia bacterium]|nr:hypothetical protein [Acidimicrobiia bacterium]
MRDVGKLTGRILGLGTVMAALFLFVAFSWFVVISWAVLRAALGTVPLLLVLAVAAVAAGTWASVAYGRLRRPARRPLSRPRRVGVAAVSLWAVICGAVSVPATRARLESNKCLRIAAPDRAAQARCHDWLESRRQWWTLGLSHQNPGRSAKPPGYRPEARRFCRPELAIIASSGRKSLSA